MGVVTTVRALRARLDAWRAARLSIGFAPTMGALHDGHLSLVKQARSLADRTIVSIFVNPKQFAAHEDLASYPRDEARDLELLRAAGCHLAYCPAPEEMYPEGFQTAVTVEKLSAGLCGVSRPHFFGGVATVVLKLLNQCAPDVAVFGEKDFQQLRVIQQMARDLDLKTKIVGAPILREADGLALSSRNAYLAPEERRVAGRLNGVIADVAAALAKGAPVAAALEEGRAALGAAGFNSIDYLEIRSEAELSPLGPGPVGKTPARVFVAVTLGRTRLIDNWKIGA
ncbi:MAG: pantoate--beta-alanine ligase [Amphiplicatus sp.]